MNTWELTLATASERNIPVIVVLPDDSPDKQAVADDIARRFHLDPERAGFAFVASRRGRGGKSGWLMRDAAVIRLADILIPISIRPGGNLDAALADNSGKIYHDFVTSYRKSSRPRPKYETLAINPDLRDGEWLIHFTRSVPGPWPDETEYDYYHAVRRSGAAYCRSALATLNHILATGIIHGSARNIRCGQPAVGFTCFSREHCRNLFRYRPRLVNPYFEPYGIAIRREAAPELDIRPVRYGTPDLYATLPQSERIYFQNVGSGGERWKQENEWRRAGDLALAKIPPEMGRVIVPTAADRGAAWAPGDFTLWPLFAQNDAM